MSATDWVLLAYGVLGSIAAGMVTAYWIRRWWYPWLIARRVIRRSRL